jgi:hypothetical protein
MAANDVVMVKRRHRFRYLISIFVHGSGIGYFDFRDDIARPRLDLLSVDVLAPSMPMETPVRSANATFRFVFIGYLPRQEIADCLLERARQRLLRGVRTGLYFGWVTLRIGTRRVNCLPIEAGQLTRAATY